MMKSDCQENETPSPYNEILKMLTAISSCMVAGHQDLQNQLTRNDLKKLETEFQHVRDENAKLYHELHQEFSATLGQPFVTSNTPVTSSATGSSSDFQT
jgi:hypothetical protein